MIQPGNQKRLLSHNQQTDFEKEFHKVEFPPGELSHHTKLEPEFCKNQNSGSNAVAWLFSIALTLQTLLLQYPQIALRPLRNNPHRFFGHTPA